jgi:hypothetical protein
MTEKVPSHRFPPDMIPERFKKRGTAKFRYGDGRLFSNTTFMLISHVLSMD